MEYFQIIYELIRSDRKTCQIQVKADGRVVVRAPRRMQKKDIDRFISDKHDWIVRALEKTRIEREQLGATEPLTHEEIDRLANEALEYIPKRAEYYASIMGVEYGNITIRNQKTRWGSCSGKKN